VQGLAGDGADLDGELGGGKLGAADEAGVGQVFGAEAGGVFGLVEVAELGRALEAAL